MPIITIKSLPIEDRWILSQTSRAVVDVQNALLSFQFSRAIALARDFFWDVLCDWYVELVKPRMGNAAGNPSSVAPASRRCDEARQVLAFVLDQSLRLLHPFVPYITEGLWKYLNQIAPKRGLPGVPAKMGRPSQAPCKSIRTLPSTHRCSRPASPPRTRSRRVAVPMFL